MAFRPAEPRPIVLKKSRCAERCPPDARSFSFSEVYCLRIRVRGAFGRHLFVPSPGIDFFNSIRPIAVVERS